MPQKTNAPLSASSFWFASDFAAEIGVRNYPRLAVFSGDLRGAVHARSQWPSPSVEAVRGDQVGDLLAGDRGRDQPGRGRPQVAHRRIDGDRDTAHGQGRRLGRAGTQTGTTWHATRLAVGGGTGGDRAADRGGQGAGDRAVGCAGCGRFPTPGYTAGGYGAATPAPWSTGRRAGIRCTRCCPRRSPRSSTWPNAGAPSTARIASWPTAAPTSTWCGSRRPRSAAS